MSLKRALAGLMLGTLTAAVVLAPALPASASDDDPNRIGSLIVAPTSGTLTDGGKWTSVSTAAGQICPAGFQSRSFLYAFKDGLSDFGGYQSIGAGARPSNYPLSNGTTLGIVATDTTISRNGDYAWSSTWTQNSSSVLVVTPGLYELRHTCQAASSYAFTDKYYAAWFQVNEDRTWQIVDGPVQKTATTTSVVASGTTSTAVTLTATVSPAEAAGTVTFKNGGTAIGDPVAVTGGAASVQVSSLSPQTAYEFTADYSGDSSYQPSSGSASVTTPAVVVADTATATATVTVPVATSEPQAPTGLKISVEPGAVTLTGPAERAEGEAWTATGQLGNVTVNDDRQDATSGAWTLNGKSSAFTSGTNTIAASNLGWTPAKVSGPGSAGAGATDLSSDKPLATGTASADQNVATTVGAGLTLVVPATAANGNYSATLTLTLI